MEALSEAAARLGINLFWDATAMGTPAGHSYITVQGVRARINANPQDTIAEADMISAILPHAHLAIHTGY